MNDKQIMLIEDNPDDRDLTIRAFKKNNVLNPIIVAMNGDEALAMLLGDDHRYQDNPALILLDLKLPKVDGLEVLRRIRADQRTRVVPVFVLTSSKEEEDLRTAYDLGANGYVRKPIAFSRIHRGGTHCGRIGTPAPRIATTSAIGQDRARSHHPGAGVPRRRPGMTILQRLTTFSRMINT